MHHFDVFISYRRADVGAARALEKLLSVFGHNVFLDVKQIEPGTSWEGAIDRALRSAKTMFVLWSRNAAASEYVTREWQGVSDACKIVPVRLDDTPLPSGLDRHEGIELPVHERLAARIAELVREGRSREQATEIVNKELAASGVELTAAQSRAIEDFSRSVRPRIPLGALLAWLMWLLRHGSRTLVQSPIALGALVLLGVGAGAVAKSPPDSVRAICEDGPTCERAAAVAPEARDYTAILDKVTRQLSTLQKEQRQFKEALQGLGRCPPNELRPQKAPPVVGKTQPAPVPDSYKAMLPALDSAPLTQLVPPVATTTTDPNEAARAREPPPSE